MPFLQMLGLVVNTFIETSDYVDCVIHRENASKMDLVDILTMIGVRSVTPLASRSEATAMEADSEAGPSTTPRAQTPMEDAAGDPATGLYILGVSEGVEQEGPVHTPYGTPTSRVGLPSTAFHTPRAAIQTSGGAGPSRMEDSSASSEEEATPPSRTPDLPAIDVLDMRARPSLDVYRENRRRRNKVPYVEFGINDVVVISDEDEEEVKMYDMVRGVPEGPISVKKEAMTVAELDEKMAKRMNDEIAQRISENNQEHSLKMQAIQLELERQRKESQEMHAQLMGFFAQLSARPQVVYAAPPETSNAPAYAMPPPPVVVQSRPSTPLAVSHDDLRTHVRNTAGHTLAPTSVIVSADDDSAAFSVRRRGSESSGHDPARHTPRVEESQDSPAISGGADCNMVDAECVPSANAPGADQETELVGTQASQAESGAQHPETEILAVNTDARPHVGQTQGEGGSASASPPHAKVTNLA